MAAVGDIVQCWPTSVNQTLLGVVYDVIAGPPEEVVVRGINYDADFDTSYGDNPDGGFSYGADPFEIATSPGVGKAVIITPAGGADLSDVEGDISALDGRVAALESAGFAPAYGYILATSGSAISLSSSWTTLTGGTLSAGAQGMTYNSGTGALDVVAAGVYRLEFSATQSRLVGLTAPDLDVAIHVNGSATDCLASHTLAAIADSRNVAASIVLALAAGDDLTLRTRSSLSLNITTNRYLWSVQRIA